MTTDSATKPGRLVVWPIAVLVLLSIPIIFYGLGSYGLVGGDEANYHYMARHMAQTGDWTRLEITGEHRVYDTFMNAPIQYWARAALILAFGDNYWTMRILSAFFALLSVLMTYRLVAYVANVPAALLGSLIQLTTFQYAYLHCARTGELEPMICFFFTLTAYLFLRAVENGRSFMPHHICLIVVMNLKLPWIIVPVLAELVYFALTRESRRRFRDWALAGLILPLGLVWHSGQVLWLGGDALAVFQRMAGQASGLGLSREHALPVKALHYGQTMASGAFPYVLAYPFAIVGLLAARSDRRDRLRLRFIMLCLAAVIVFFIVVAKNLPWYIIPTYPFLSACLGIWLDRIRRATRQWWIVPVGALLLAMMICVRVELPNPFSDIPLRMRPELFWRDFLHLMPVGGAAVVVLLLMGVLYGARFVLGNRTSQALSVALTAALIGFGLFRVLHALQYMGHVTPMETFAQQFAADRAAGKPVVFPVPIPGTNRARARYFFGDDYLIVWAPERNNVCFWLVCEGRTPGNPIGVNHEWLKHLANTQPVDSGGGGPFDWQGRRARGDR